MVGAVNRPKAWPSFSFQSNEILCSLEKMNAWKFTQEPHNANRGVTLIAQSASNHPRLQSYVATGGPLWLEELFENERSAALVVQS
ncbi:hypothetical protein V5N11_033259 [Cardamine amara subsp. amara]|uniref:Uncharacterized protein n=1 Tax=Cardamine amara subsp. amara TaxID=228776 RepID=A0ABD1ADS9_CARAN